MDTNELLDKAGAKLGLSDYKLCHELGCSNQVLSNWRKGKGQPDTYAAWRLAEILEMDPREVLFIIEGERDKEERRDYWADMMRRFREGAQAWALGITIVFGSGGLLNSEAKADIIQRHNSGSPNSISVHYVNLWRRILAMAMNAITGLKALYT